VTGLYEVDVEETAQEGQKNEHAVALCRAEHVPRDCRAVGISVRICRPSDTESEQPQQLSLLFMILRPSVQARIYHCGFLSLALRPFSSAMATANATHEILDPNNSSKNTLKLENVCLFWREPWNYEAKGSNI